MKNQKQTESRKQGKGERGKGKEIRRNEKGKSTKKIREMRRNSCKTKNGNR